MKQRNKQEKPAVLALRSMSALRLYSRSSPLRVRSSFWSYKVLLALFGMTKYALLSGTRKLYPIYLQVKIALLLGPGYCISPSLKNMRTFSENRRKFMRTLREV